MPVCALNAHVISKHASLIHKEESSGTISTNEEKVQPKYKIKFNTLSI